MFGNVNVKGRKQLSYDTVLVVTGTRIQGMWLQWHKKQCCFS